MYAIRHTRQATTRERTPIRGQGDPQMPVREAFAVPGSDGEQGVELRQPQRLLRCRQRARIGHPGQIRTVLVSHAPTANRRLVRDYETLPDNSASMLTIAMIDNLAKRLTTETAPTWR
jgi:hypothetical protein